MKKLLSCMLVVIMLFAFASVYAEPETDIVSQFLKETEWDKQDIALVSQYGDQAADLVIRVDGDNLHFVSRNNGAEYSHVQLNPTGVYVGSNGTVTMLRYATVATILEDVAKELDAILEEEIKNIPEEEIPTQEEIKVAIYKLAYAAARAEAQEQADAATLSSAAMAFAGNFKPENILDIKEEDGSVEISLRSEAFASALADAIDGLMMNPDLANLVDRQALTEGGESFAEYQHEWLMHRDEYLEAIRSIQSTDAIDEDGHWVSHFQIGEEGSIIKIVVADTDAWIDAEDGEAEVTFGLGFKDEDPMLVYELAVDEDSYNEKLSSGNSKTEVKMDYDEKQISEAEVTAEIEGQEWMKAYFTPDSIYMKGPNGAISTSVRETWLGTIRYELVAENPQGEEYKVAVDFYEDGDSLVAELNATGSDKPAMFKMSRIDKLNIENLGAAKDINEITVEKINAELENLLKSVVITVK